MTAPRRGGDFHSILDAVDAAMARQDDSDSARVAILQAYATVWAAIGYGLWLMVELMIRILLALWRLVRRKKQVDPDEGWTTTMKKKGRA